jgi:hypothetical protein
MRRRSADFHRHCFIIEFRHRDLVSASGVTELLGRIDNG